MRKLVLLGGILLSAALTWFAISNYLSARPVAEENLRGLALSLTAAIENIALHDPSLRNLSTFRTHDIAFFALVDRQGLYRFHTNPDLIGTPLQGTMPRATLQDGATSSTRITLRTGENAFEFNSPLYLPGETLALRLTLHTYRADAVIRRARLNMTILLCLLAAGWILAVALYRLTRREERRQLEMARRENLAQLGEMGAMLAHEIRNPLAGIKGYAQIIEKKPQDERNSGFARRIVAEAQRLETLVSDLLAYARSDRAMATVDMCEVIAHTAAFLRHEAEQLHVNIITECPEGMLITGNRDRLGQALLNLGKNAIQAMPEGGTLRITAGADGKQVVIRVKDSGHGIGPGELPRIFEPFFTTKAKGTGLGLALCKKITEEHGGSIEVHSTVGQGTTVSITIPVRRNHQGRS
ncbi:nitrogen regulation protein NR(II) [Geobacter sp. AOG1]|uniref:two-component system sensor histidine kinase NtrB n=1 Tax=Geobacter sp. AOG1 TaxID=1566346 RepID=UPI001CC5D204|nr:ATP-binding protein [Geobacter sp. AOG1]GFE59104.1 sensor histidine kinase [Geobacter sp. AOG1]